MLRLTADKEAWFPNLSGSNYQITSQCTDTYNCIAHAANDQNAWWWPVGLGSHWPIGQKVETLDCFVAAYASLGYAPAPSPNLTDTSFERIAIYVDKEGTPTHAARQLNSGRWTSKLGEWEDIEHDSLEAVEDLGDLGLGYGKCVLILERKALLVPPQLAPSQ